MIQLVLRRPHLAAAVQSIVSRVLLSMLLVLPQIPPPSLSPDTTLHGRVLAQVREICVELGSSTSTMSKSLGLVIRAGVIDRSGDVSYHIPFFWTGLSRLIAMDDRH